MQIEPAISELLAELKTAVLAGNRELSTQLEHIILQRLAIEANKRDTTEREVRAIMATPPPAETAPLFSLESLHTVRGPLKAGESKMVPVGATSAQTGDILYPVWFGTNREPTADGQDFTAERHSQTTLGRVDVHIPEAHHFGETGSDFWTKLKRLNFRNDTLRVEQVTALNAQGFFAEINQSLAAAQAAGVASQALFFLHGYNTTFKEAAIRAAQIGCDLKVGGATAFFSWPSGGSVAAYPADEAAIEASERAITTFLVEFMANCQAEQVHVIAHSMGNRGLLRALQRIAADAETRSKVKFGQIFLAAPDVDRDLFQDLAALYPAYSTRTTLYASHRDLPVHLSAQLHRAPRAGYFEPYTVAANIDTIAVPNFNVDLLGHGYFAQAEALLHDIYDLMRQDAAPAKRQRFTVPAPGELFWRFRR